MTIADNLALLHSTKTAIKAAIEDKGVIVGAAPFADYPAKIAEISGGGGGGGSTPLEWSRPEWRTLPSMTDTDQKFIGLHAVYPEDGNFCALTAAGAYTVDWGDGTTTNHATGTQANKLFDYNSAALAGTDAPVTFTASTSTVNRTAHGFTNGKTVTFWNIAGTTGVVDGQVYFVINATADTFQVSATAGGSALTLTNDGTASLARYKQAVVVVTPQAGQSLTALSLNVKHSQAGTQLYSAGWLDILVGSPNFSTTGFDIGMASTNETVRKNSIERVRVLNLGATNTLESRFRNLRELAVVELPSTAAVTNMSYMFQNCSSLQTVPLFNTQAVTNMSYMFQNCTSLQTVPLFNTQAVTNMSSMFISCYSLQTVPLFNTQAVTDMNTMFGYCYSLQTVPLFNTQAVTSMSGMFYNCYSLQTVLLFNTQAVTSMSTMFYNCYSLQTVLALNTTAVTSSDNFINMFANCNSLSRIQAKNFRFTFSVANCKLSAAALNEIYTNLPTVTGQTITVTGNYGTAADYPYIAVAKGWTVTG